MTTMTMQLTSERLVYTKILATEVLLFREITMNEAVMKYITGKKHSAEDADQRFVNVMEVNNRHSDVGFFWARRKEDGHLVGYVKIVYLGSDRLEVGYALLPEFWGKQYASEMLKCLIDYNYNTLKAKELIGIVDTQNPASIRVLTKQNFIPDKQALMNGRNVGYYKLVCG